MFLAGPLSRPIWLPIATHSACQTCEDPGGKPNEMAHKAPLPDVQSCLQFCQEFADCQAVDWFDHTKWCTLYSDACTKPTATWDNASSYQIAVACTLHNGTSGVLIAGHCRTGIQVPSVWSIMSQEVPAMLHSPRSWACSLAVALLYAYLMSPVARKRLQPITGPLTAPVLCCWKCYRQGGIALKIALMTVLLISWVALTVQKWGPPGATLTELKDTERTMPMGEWAWLGVSVLVFLFLYCSAIRSCLLGTIVAVGGCVMSAFTALATLALGTCFDVSTLGAAGAASLLSGGAAAEGAAAMEAGAAGEALVAGEAVAGGDAAVATEGAVVADTAAAGAAAGEAAVAADAAAAAEAAAVAEAAATAEGVAAMAVFCSVM
mmetsp:Transcript_2493/g.8469  ORF Transcript_2493/g.8469 Transcript_2493/m.8469 type:complete len:378 (+) Transcript_2493:795-1928(+)